MGCAEWSVREAHHQVERDQHRQRDSWRRSANLSRCSARLAARARMALDGACLRGPVDVLEDGERRVLPRVPSDDERLRQPSLSRPLAKYQRRAGPVCLWDRRQRHRYDRREGVIRARSTGMGTTPRLRMATVAVHRAEERRQPRRRRRRGPALGSRSVTLLDG